MSPKFNISMILFTPYYVFDALFANDKFSNNSKSIRIIYYAFISSIWLSLWLFLSGNLIINYISANLGILGLIMSNVYSHVDNTKTLFDKCDHNSHIIFDITVTIGSLSFMVLFAYIPYLVYYQYVSINAFSCNLGLLNTLSIIIIIHMIFVLFYKELFTNMPKSSTENYFMNYDKTKNVYIYFYYICGIIFMLIMLRDNKFVSTMRFLFSKLYL